jgi:signal transduction histidine kinase
LDISKQLYPVVDSRLILSELSNFNAHLQESALGRDIKSLFIAAPDLPGIVIVSNLGEFVGLVSRRLFMELFSKPYRVELFSDRNASYLLRNIKSEPLVFDGDSTIDDVASKIVMRSSSDFSEPVVLQLGKGEFRVIDCQVVLSAMAQSYADQFRKLQIAKNTIVENEKLASLGSLVAGIAHEINTPLGISITALSSIFDQVGDLQRRFESGQVKRSELTITLSDMHSLSSMALKTLNRAADLVRSFKQVSADQVSEARRDFELSEELKHIVNSLRPMAKRQGVEIILEDGNSVTMNSFPGALSQVVTNLVVNAITHAFEGIKDGVVTIRFNADQGGFVKVVVCDNGTGIPKENLDRIFEPFFTTKRGIGGTGLGLSIVHNLVRSALGGMISVETMPEGGANFLIVMPLKSPEETKG